MTTREKIIDISLTLFSSQGFEGTSVKNIADAVGIKDSSLYKHFRSKQEIFDTIVAEMSRRMEEMGYLYGLPDDRDIAGASTLFGGLTEDMFLELSKKIFLFYLKDEFASRFRRMLALEQYRNREIYTIYREIFMDAAITYQTTVFGEMIKLGLLNGQNPEAMSIHFYGPIFFLLNKYDQEPEKEQEALEVLKRQVQEFRRIYGK